MVVSYVKGLINTYEISKYEILGAYLQTLKEGLTNTFPP